MSLCSKTVSKLILFITAIVCSKVLFALFDDPEGPNLLIVVVMTAVIFCTSLPILVWKSTLTELKKLFWAVFVQVLFTIVLYVCLA